MATVGVAAACAGAADATGATATAYATPEHSSTPVVVRPEGWRADVADKRLHVVIPRGLSCIESSARATGDSVSFPYCPGVRLGEGRADGGHDALLALVARPLNTPCREGQQHQRLREERGTTEHWEPTRHVDYFRVVVLLVVVVGQSNVLHGYSHVLRIPVTLRRSLTSASSSPFPLTLASRRGRTWPIFEQSKAVRRSNNLPPTEQSLRFTSDKEGEGEA